MENMIIGRIIASGVGSLACAATVGLLGWHPLLALLVWVVTFTLGIFFI